MKICRWSLNAFNGSAVVLVLMLGAMCITMWKMQRLNPCIDVAVYLWKHGYFPNIINATQLLERFSSTQSCINTFIEYYHGIRVWENKGRMHYVNALFLPYTVTCGTLIFYLHAITKKMARVFRNNIFFIDLNWFSSG